MLMALAVEVWPVLMARHAVDCAADVTGWCVVELKTAADLACESLIVRRRLDYT